MRLVVPAPQFIQLDILPSCAAVLQFVISPLCTTRAPLPTHGGHPPQVRLHDALAFRIMPLHPLPSHSEWRPWLGQPMYERHEEDEGWIPPLLDAPAAAN